MPRKIVFRVVMLLSFFSLLSAILLPGVTNALVSQDSRNWFWGSDTNAPSVVSADVDGDGGMEIVTGGYHNDGTQWAAQLHVWNGTTLNVEKVQAWLWGTNTQVVAVAVGNTDADGGAEIVTGGSFFDGTRWIAQLHVWNGSTLAVERVQNWYWVSNTYINSVAIGDVDADGQVEIVSGGANLDGTRYVAQLHVWSGSTLAVEGVSAWYITSDTDITSVAIANITGGTTRDIVTGGSFNDGVRKNAQLLVWNGSTLAVQRFMNWYATSDTSITSVAIGNYSGGISLDIITCGSFNDSVNTNAQLMVFNGTNLAVLSSSNWINVNTTVANSVAIGNFGAGNRIVVAGSFFDNIRVNAQLNVWA